VVAEESAFTSDTTTVRHNNMIKGKKLQSTKNISIPFSKDVWSKVQCPVYSEYGLMLFKCKCVTAFIKQEMDLSKNSSGGKSTDMNTSCTQSLYANTLILTTALKVQGATSSNMELLVDSGTMQQMTPLAKDSYECVKQIGRSRWQTN
jgi:hypothetical protein